MHRHLFIGLIYLLLPLSVKAEKLNIDEIKNLSSESRATEDRCVFDKFIKILNNEIKESASHGLFEIEKPFKIGFKYQDWPDCIKLAERCDSKDVCIKRSKEGICIDYKTIKTDCRVEVKYRYSVVSYYLLKGFRVFLDGKEWHYDNFSNGVIKLRDIVKKDYNEYDFKLYAKKYDGRNFSIDEIYDFYLSDTRVELTRAETIMLKW